MTRDVNIKVKKLNSSARIPRYALEGDAGVDMYCTSVNFTDKYIEYGTGLAIEIPLGYVGLLFPRSSVSEKDLILANCVGVIDPNYRGEIKYRYKRLFHTGDSESHMQECEYCDNGLVDLHPNEPDEGELMDCQVCGGVGELEEIDMYEVGDRCGQLVVVERFNLIFEEAESLVETSRGEGGFGSTNKQENNG